MLNKKVTILDYEMCNLFNVARAFEVCGASVTVTSNPNEALLADRLVVPGVGAFRHAMRELTNLGLADSIKLFAEAGRPLLGICVGMQILFDGSEEFGDHLGLGLLAGRVAPIPNETKKGHIQRIPHIGWSHLKKPINKNWVGTIFSDFENESPAVYFVHSFSANPVQANDIMATCDYGGHDICAAVQKNNIVGTQFHPELSGPKGLAIISNFISQ